MSTPNGHRPLTLVCTLGNLDRYMNPKPGGKGKNEEPTGVIYTYPGDGASGPTEVKGVVVPISALVKIFAPEQVLVMTPGIADETFAWLKDEIESAGDVKLLDPRKIPIPGIEASSEEVLGQVFAVCDEFPTVHLDLSLGLRTISFESLLATNYLAMTNGHRIHRVTCIQIEGREPGEPAPILDLTFLLHLPRLETTARILHEAGRVTPLFRAVGRAFPGSLSDEDQTEAGLLQDNLDLLRPKHVFSKNGRQRLQKVIRILEEKARTIPLLKPLAERVAGELGPIMHEEFDNHQSPHRFLALAQWYLKHNMPAQALIISVEGAAHIAGGKTGVLDGDGAHSLDDPNTHRVLERAAFELGASPDKKPAQAIIQRFAVHHRDQRNTLAHAQMSFRKEDMRQLSKADVQEAVQDLAKLIDLLP